MKIKGYLTVKSTGAARFTKNKPGLDWNELSLAINLNVPDELFKRPLITANIEISKDILPKPQPVDLILNTKELIEQSTGAKIEFVVKPYEEDAK